MKAWQYAITGGDDYELLFTLPADQLLALQTHINTLPNALGLSCFPIGKITACGLANNKLDAISFMHFKQPVKLNSTGWDHFKKR
jgi:thiamine-monophosphate kinase